MATASSSSSSTSSTSTPSASVTLEALAASLAYDLDISRVLDNDPADIANIVLAGLIVLMVPSSLWKQWKARTLWIFRLERTKHGKFFVLHPLNFLLPLLGVSIILLVSALAILLSPTPTHPQLQYRRYIAMLYAASIIMLVLGSGVVIGTFAALRFHDRQAGEPNLLRSLLSNPTNWHLAYTPSFVLIGTGVPLVVLNDVYVARAFSKLAQLQQLAQEAPSTSATASDLELFTSAKVDFARAYNVFRIYLFVWPAYCLIGGMILAPLTLYLVRYLWRQMQRAKTSNRLPPETTRSTVRYLQLSITIVTGVYLLILATAILLSILSLSQGVILSNILKDGVLNIRDAQEVTITGLPWFCWILTVAGLAASALTSSRLLAAVSAHNEKVKTVTRESKDWSAIASTKADAASHNESSTSQEASPSSTESAEAITKHETPSLYQEA